MFLLTYLCVNSVTLYNIITTSSLPHSGAQGEFTGLCAIRSYLNSKGEHHRKVCDHVDLVDCVDHIDHVDYTQ